MDLLPKLGAIVCYGTGYDEVDLRQRPNADYASATARAPMRPRVADIAVTLMLAATRRLQVADEYVRSGGLRRLQNHRR